MRLAAVLALTPAACGVDFVAPDQTPEPPHLFVRVFYDQPVDPVPDEPCLRLVMTLTPGHTAQGVARTVERPTARVNEVEVEPYSVGDGRVLRYEHRLHCEALSPRFSVEPPVVANSVWAVSPFHVPVMLRGGEAVVQPPWRDGVTLPLDRGNPSDWTARFNRTTWRFAVSSASGDVELRQSTGTPPAELSIEAGELDGAPPGPVTATLQLEALGSAVFTTPVESRMEFSIQGRVAWRLAEPYPPR